MSHASATSERLLETLDLYEFGVGLMASSLRRRHPTASAGELKQLLDDWLVAGSGSAEDDERAVTERYR